MRSRAKLIIILTVLLFALTGCGPNALIPVTGESGEFEVVFLDVGQADCIYIRCGESRMLIDGGNRADSAAVTGFLMERGVKSLDYVAATHPHEDHCGGLEAVLNGFKVSKLLTSVTEYDSSAFEKFRSAAAAHELELSVPVPNETYLLGSAYFTVLGPLREHENMNDNSIVIKLVYNGISFIFTGDAGYDAEQDIIAEGYELDADVLQVGHHGSSSSACYLWLREIMPKYAVISVGKDNEYGHPSERVLSRLRDAGARVLRTDELGSITMKVENGKLYAGCEKPETLSPAA